MALTIQTETNLTPSKKQDVKGKNGKTIKTNINQRNRQRRQQNNNLGATKRRRRQPHYRLFCQILRARRRRSQHNNQRHKPNRKILHTRRQHNELRHLAIFSSRLQRRRSRQCRLRRHCNQRTCSTWRTVQLRHHGHYHFIHHGKLERAHKRRRRNRIRIPVHGNQLYNMVPKFRRHFARHNLRPRRQYLIHRASPRHKLIRSQWVGLNGRHNRHDRRPDYHHARRTDVGVIDNSRPRLGETHMVSRQRRRSNILSS